MKWTKEEQEEYEQHQAQCKHLVESAKTRPDLWKIKTVHNGEKHFIQEANDDKMIWIVDEFKGEYVLDFLMKESIDAIIELTNKDAQGRVSKSHETPDNMSGA